ncbi:glutathione S-transferase family protein [Natronospirillum operosum]|uniref:Glutathione S-transferase family protein n=1 Tax=Natronospirillum operosum TaxID=2759953 RepID=A0A4Z0WAF7_9GAMM|nr:glutathione S-transferase family protein [Natronospirillum operosum]TGG90640.1 glutathione S-transferase family protein [Natronospirillum operosum]
MGLLVEGQWHDKWYDTGKTGGRFKREEAQFRSWVTADGSAGPTGQDGFRAESGRYHLFVSMACPWAHRTLIVRHLKGLDAHIGVSVVHPDMLSNGWEYSGPTLDSPTPVGDQLYGHDFHYQLYLKADRHYTGRVTVPVLWDRERETMVSNESADIIRMFNSAFDDITGNTDDFYPESLRADIDAINERVYHTVNNGVYKTGFATTQQAYEEAFTDLFDSLDWLDELLGERRYLAGDRITEADWRLFTTLVRFDAVYVGHFKCNLRRIADYPNLSGYLRELYQQPGIAATVDMTHIKRHYYYSHDTINPTRIVPKGPALNLDAPHGRG